MLEAVEPAADHRGKSLPRQGIERRSRQREVLPRRGQVADEAIVLSQIEVKGREERRKRQPRKTAREADIREVPCRVEGAIVPGDRDGRVRVEVGRVVRDCAAMERVAVFPAYLAPEFVQRCARAGILTLLCSAIADMIRSIIGSGVTTGEAPRFPGGACRGRRRYRTT